jgi:hypothetical protein
MGLKKGKAQIVEVEPESDEITVREGDTQTATEMIGLKITTGSDGKYFIGVTHTINVPEGKNRDDMAKAQIAFVITHRRLAEQALQNS